MLTCEGRHPSGPTTQRRAYNKKPAPKNNRNTFRFRGLLYQTLVPGDCSDRCSSKPEVGERKKESGRKAEELDSDNKRIKQVTSLSIPKDV